MEKFNISITTKLRMDIHQNSYQIHKVDQSLFRFHIYILRTIIQKQNNKYLIIPLYNSWLLKIAYDIIFISLITHSLSKSQLLRLPNKQQANGF